MKPPQIVGITKSLVTDSEGQPLSAESFIAYTARVSNPSNQMNDATAPKLLEYLVRNSHWSPFEQVDLTMEIETSRAIMAQILRHWSCRFQEFSLRYSEVAEGIDWSHVEARKKGDTNRQGSLDVDDSQTAAMRLACQTAERSYQTLLEAGIAPECARMVLPLATPTRAYMKGSVRTWMTYFYQRLDSHCQKEHRLVANQMFALFKGEFPIIAKMVAEQRPKMTKDENWIH